MTKLTFYTVIGTVALSVFLQSYPMKRTNPARFFRSTPASLSTRVLSSRPQSFSSQTPAAMTYSSRTNNTNSFFSQTIYEREFNALPFVLGITAGCTSAYIAHKKDIFADEKKPREHKKKHRVRIGTLPGFTEIQRNIASLFEETVDNHNENLLQRKDFIKDFLGIDEATLRQLIQKAHGDSKKVFKTLAAKNPRVAQIFQEKYETYTIDQLDHKLQENATNSDEKKVVLLCFFTIQMSHIRPT